MHDRVALTSDSGRAGLGRRQFLFGAAATALLAACGGDDSPGDAANGETESDLSVVRFFGPYYGVGQVARIPFGIADIEGLLSDDLAPASITASIADPSGTVVLEEVEVTKLNEGLPRPYYVVTLTPEVEGFYDLTLTIDGEEVISQFQVVAADAPGVAGRIGPGDTFPAVVTPTVADPMGLTPLCTRTPPCDLHAASVDTLVTTTPMVVLVATPAFCQTVICGPVLDILLGEMANTTGMAFVHLEVYTNPAENEVPPVPADYAPIIGQLGLSYEPVLYTVAADGTVVDRVDYIFGAEEIRAAIGALVA